MPRLITSRPWRCRSAAFASTAKAFSSPMRAKPGLIGIIGGSVDGRPFRPGAPAEQGASAAARKAASAGPLLSARATGEGQPETPSYEDPAAEASEKFRARGVHEPCPPETRGDGPSRVGDCGHQRGCDAHRSELRPGWKSGIQELGKKGGKEYNRLRI